MIDDGMAGLGAVDRDEVSADMALVEVAAMEEMGAFPDWADGSSMISGMGSGLGFGRSPWSDQLYPNHRSGGRWPSGFSLDACERGINQLRQLIRSTGKTPKQLHKEMIAARKAKAAAKRAAAAAA